MFKYEVKKENIEVKSNKNDSWSEEEIINAYWDMSWHYSELLGSFDTFEEASDFFEAEKERCSSYIQKGYIWYFLEADIIILEEVEYDNDGEFISANWSNEFAVPVEYVEEEF